MRGLLLIHRPQSQTNIRQFKTFKSQAGWTFWGLLFVTTVIVFFAYIGMQLVPIYSANENVKNAMELSLADQDLRRINRHTIVKRMQRQLYLDGSIKLLDFKTDLSVERSRREFVLRTKYQREIPVFYNVFVLVKFDNHITRSLVSE